MREGQTDDCDREHDGPEEMIESETEAEHHEPEDVADDSQRTVGARATANLLAEGREGREAEFDGLQAERNADDGEARDGAAEDEADAGEEATEEEPDDVAEKVHAVSTDDGARLFHVVVPTREQCH